MWRKFKENIYAVVDLNIVIMIGIVFAALMVIAYINFTLEGSLIPDYPNGSDAANAAWNTTYADMANSTGNITTGYCGITHAPREKKIKGIHLSFSLLFFLCV
jgi:hypothetical protein